MPDTNTDPIAASGQTLVQPELGGSPDSWGEKTNLNWTRVVDALNTLWSTLANKLAKASNLSDLPDKSAARGYLGVAIGSNVQAYSPLLGSIAGLTLAANNYIYASGPDAVTVGTISGNGRSLIGTDYAGMRTNLGLVIGTHVQGYHANLASLAGASSDVATFIASADKGAMRSNLGLTIGSSVQAHSATLSALSTLSLAANKLVHTDASGAPALTSFSTDAKALVGADVSAMKSLLSLNNVPNLSAASIIAGVDSAFIVSKLGAAPTSITGYTGAQTPSQIKTALSLGKGDVGLGNVQDLTPAGMGSALLTAAADSNRVILFSTASPTSGDGADSNIWLQYTP